MTRASAVALFAVALGTGCVPDPGRPDRAADVYTPVLDAEDARPAGGTELERLLSATGLEDPFIRRTAVRALGRLESPELSDAIAEHLDDADAGVRVAAAEALAQSVHLGNGSTVLQPLLARVEVERDPEVRGMLARSLGRLTLDDDERRRAADALVALANPVGEASVEVLVGVALGFESLVRGSDGRGLSGAAAAVLTAILQQKSGRADADDPADPSTEAEASDPGPSATEQARRARTHAAAALGRSRRLSLELIESALDDPEPEVRRTVVTFLGAAPPSTREGLILRAFQDSAPTVRIAGVQYLAGLQPTPARCALLISASEDESAAPVRVSALQSLSRPCPGPVGQRATLLRSAAEIGEPDRAWQPAAQALLSLTRIDPESASRLLPDFAANENPFVRAWAARTASALRDVSTLFDLAVDPSANVRTEAIRGLFAIEGHGLDDFLVEQLEYDDPQLLLTVTGLLEGAPEREFVADALLSTFERISTAERETWRDPRVALLERLDELGGESLAERLTPHLRDYDPVVAQQAARVLETWTDGEHIAEPQPLPRAPVPTRAELRALEASTLTLHMRDGGALVVELLADQAPTNVARLVRLAEAGYYDGLTFHRWVPNFVIQGGSPGANEYQGDGPYTRDEVGGVPHWRGTVGLSTRGRDTGDGQLFINLVDNPRLNYDYTVIGRLVSGYDVLDGILEGAVIDRAVVTTTP